MNVFTRVTLRTLRENRVRTLVTIIGIVLSTAMFTAVTTMVVSFQDYLYRSTLAITGDWHGAFLDLPAGEADGLAGDGLVESAFFCQNLGYAERGVDPASNDKPYWYVQAMDASYREHMVLRLVAGRLPETPDELVVNANLTDGDGETYRLGQTVTVALGDRVWNGETLGQYNPYCFDDENGPAEALEVRETRTYTVVGLMEQPYTEDYSAPGSTALTVWDADRPAGRVDAYFRLTDPSAAFAFQLGQPVDGVQHWFYSDDRTATTVNSQLLMTMGFSRYDTYRQYLVSLATILTALIVFGSVALIYNAFSISVAERTRQFGLLSSVGATRPQIRRMVMTEALLVSAAGIPLGLLAGLAGMGVTLHFLGGRFYVLLGVEDVALRLCVSWQSLAAAAALALGTVLLSAWVPSRRAMRVPAMEAIRQTGDVAVTGRPVRAGRLTYRLFGLPGLLARKQYRRSRRRYRATVVSLFMSVVLFLSASSFTAYLNDSVQTTLGSVDYDVSYTYYDRETDAYGRPVTEERLLALFRSAEHVTRASAVCSAEIGRVELTPDMMSGEARAYLLPDGAGGRAEPASSAGSGEYVGFSAVLLGADEATYRAYLEAQGLDPAVFLDTASPKAVVLARAQGFQEGRTDSVQLLRRDADRLTFTYTDSERYAEYFEDRDADTMTEAEWQAGEAYYNRQVTIPVGAVVDELPFGMNRGEYHGFCILLPPAYVRANYPTYTSTSVCAAADDPEAAGAELAALLRAEGIRADRLDETWRNGETERNMIVIARVLSYGFIALISLISVANVFNTITTNLLLRRRELAMLRSVGMTDGGFRRMLTYECLLYGARALLWGLPAATAVTYWIYRSTGIVYDTAFYVPWGAVAAAVGGVFAVVFASTLYGWRRIRRDNPIEALRREAI